MQPETTLAVERRSKARFPLRLSVRYRTMSDEPSLVGVGQTVNMSSCGLLIASNQSAPVHAGARLQLMVDWPFLLHGSTPLQLVASCRVTRCHPEEFAVKLEQYLFHTKKR
jgi:PilZ domain